MNTRVLVVASLCVFVGTTLIAGIPIDPPPTVVPTFPAGARATELSVDTVAAINQKLTLASMGAHWSGLDQAALFKEISSGDIQSAEARIQQSADNGGRDHALCHILLEIASTDLFRPYKAQICRIATDLLSAQRNIGPTRSSTKEAEFLLRGRIQETIIGDDAAAESSYRQVLGDDETAKILGAVEPLNAIKADTDGARKGAALRILAIEARRRSEDRQGGQPGEGRGED